ncbi:MAG: dihydroorotase [Chitinophagaceae bacterium]
MQLLIKKVRIISPQSTYHGKIKDIYIKDGKIKDIQDRLEPQEVPVLAEENLHISIGWMDPFADFCDPGFEYREDLMTGCLSAAAGGYTEIMLVPNTHPAIQSKSQIEYILNKNKGNLVDIHPIGAISKNLEGISLAEMYEMASSGAVAFSDGLKPLQTSGLLLKALQYVKTFKGIIIQVPDDCSISKYGLMNEGIHSTRFGMPGKPSIAEEIMISRDIELTKYADSRIHFTGVSTQKGLELITQAKKEGVQVTCSVTPYHISLSDEALEDYNANLKVNPPLRSKEDVAALLEGISNGWVDCFASHHIPQNRDAKLVEFEYAKDGMIGLETAFGIINKSMQGTNLEKIISMLTTQPREIFNIPIPKIELNEDANLTIFNPDLEWAWTEKDNQSKSCNSPFFHKILKGKVLGIIHNNKHYLYSK